MNKKSKKVSTTNSPTLGYIIIGMVALALGYFSSSYLHSQQTITTQKKIDHYVSQTLNTKSKAEIIEEIRETRPFLKAKATDIYFPIIQNELLNQNSDLIKEIVKYPNFWESFSKDKQAELTAINTSFDNLSIHFYERFSKKDLIEYLSIFNDSNFTKINQVIEEDLRAVINYELDGLKTEHLGPIRDFTMNYLNEHKKKIK